MLRRGVYIAVVAIDACFVEWKDGRGEENVESREMDCKGMRIFSRDRIPPCTMVYSNVRW